VIRRLSLVGLGLLGGSVAKAARAQKVADEIVAVGRDRARLEPALRDGMVDRISTSLEEGVAGADFCLLATPVATLTALLPAVWQALPPEAVLTDVGSTKAGIVEAAEALARGGRPLAFVGSHPMAGSEQSGYAVSRPDLFQGATVILTPTERTDSHAVKRVGAFWEALDPVTHDRATAAVSHLPHLVADALVDAVVRMDPRFFEIAGRGFKDTTRIAASDPQMWREIFQENRAGLAEALGAFRAALDELERLINAGDVAAIEAALDRIRRVREGFA
jgi:prephenate dehydrogenase